MDRPRLTRTFAALTLKASKTPSCLAHELAWLTRLSLPERHFDGAMQDDVRVQGRGHVLDVIEIVLEGLPRIVHAAVVAVELAPPHNSGTHGVALAVVRHLR